MKALHHLDLLQCDLRVEFSRKSRKRRRYDCATQRNKRVNPKYFRRPSRVNGDCLLCDLFHTYRASSGQWIGLADENISLAKSVPLCPNTNHEQRRKQGLQPSSWCL